MLLRSWVLVCAAVALAAAWPSAARAAAPACVAAAYHQYDFFVGSWNVYHKDGKQFAADVVSKQMNGCVISERWLGSQTHGVGYSAYDAGHGDWVQSFFGDDGSVLVMRGRPQGDGLLFVGDDFPKPGVVEHNRVLFRPLKGGTVEEYWTVSRDGKTWSEAFDGFFRPAAKG